MSCSNSAPMRSVPVRTLSLTEPDLPTACQHLIHQGCTAITVLPMFLGTGRHARHDLPVLVEALRQQHPAVSFEVATAVAKTPC